MRGQAEGRTTGFEDDKVANKLTVVDKGFDDLFLRLSEESFCCLSEVCAL